MGEAETKETVEQVDWEERIPNGTRAPIRRADVTLRAGPHGPIMKSLLYTALYNAAGHVLSSTGTRTESII